MKGCLGGRRRVAVGPVDPQQDGFFRERGRPGLAPEPHDDVAVAAPDFEQRPARRLVVRVPDVVRQRVNIDADLVGCSSLACRVCSLARCASSSNRAESLARRSSSFRFAWR